MSNIKQAIDKMFEIAGYNIGYDDIVKRKDSWFQKYTMTTKQEQEFKKWFMENSKYKNKRIQQKEFDSFNLMWGLTIKNI